MTSRTIKSLQSFSFSSDFCSQDQADNDELVTMSVDDLADLLSRTRQETLQSVNAEQTTAMQHIQDVSENLLKALAQMIELAEYLDRLDIDLEDRARAKHLMSSACQLIVDGQGDLFGSSQPSTNR